jgi:hypothetical protein
MNDDDDLMLFFSTGFGLENEQKIHCWEDSSEQILKIHLRVGPGKKAMLWKRHALHFLETNTKFFVRLRFKVVDNCPLSTTLSFRH